MNLEKIYNFKRSDYGRDGFHKTKSDYLFLDFIRECEKDFHKKLNPYYSNSLLANNSILLLLKSCFYAEENEIFGMETNDGSIDIEMNLKIKEYSDNNTIYAIGSNIEGRDDEPIFLISDNSFSDTQFSLKYIPDSDEENNLENLPCPRKIVKVLF